MAPLRGADKKSSTKNVGKSTTQKKTSGAKNKVSKQTNFRQSVQQKTKSKSTPARKRRKSYTDKELGIPKLNMITPVGVDLPKGKKKGKVFVDDQESMMAILAVVNARQDGQIESKMMKARHLEEIRQAKLKEAETRQEQKKSKLEVTKDSLRRKRKRKLDIGPDEITAKLQHNESIAKAARKQVSFA